MREVFLNPDHVSIWNATDSGVMPDWRRLFAGYTATLDTPACHYWKELAREFRGAKVLLLRRDPQSWYESMRATVYPILMGPEGETDPALRINRRVFIERIMDGRFEETDFAIATYRRYCANVT
jgi:hypothetical protein